MNLTPQEVKCLHDYIANNEAVYQRLGELIDVSNEKECENRDSLLKDLDASCCVEIYNKGHQLISNDFAELDGWCREEDILLLLETIGTLICVPKKIAIENHIVRHAA